MEIRPHRSIRRFDPAQTLHDDLLATIIKDAQRASNTANMQTYSLLTTPRGEALYTDLAHLHFDQPMLESASHLLTLCADFARFEAWCHAEGATPDYGNLLGLVASIIDASLFGQALLDAAEKRGVGGCFLGTTLYNPQAFADRLALPRLTVPIMGLAIGYPDPSVPLPDLTDRLPTEAIWHQGLYTPLSEEWIHATHDAFAHAPQQEASRKGADTPTLAHAYTDVRYKPTDYQRLSKSLLQFLEAQGFRLLP